MADNLTPPETQTTAVPIVAIGASAGGLEQIKLLLGAMPTDTGAAFIVIQHLDPNHDSLLTELLDQVGELPAVTIEDGMPVAADRVHILPSGHRLGIDEAGVLRLTASKAREGRPTLIDRFFRDLASTWSRRAVGIVLSGSGSDGALGLKAIRQAGGLAIAQHPDNAQFDGMPRAAAQHASPDCLLNTADMIEPLSNHLRLNIANGDQPPKADGDDISDQVLKTALERLREHGQYDFRHHKTNMLKRRLRRRMALNGVADTHAYLDTLTKSDAERARLCSDFLISVTDFFRDPASYEELEQSVIRKLLHNRRTDNPIRVWVPGCATGEEAYSIAMLLAEAIEASGRNHKFIIFATDVDDTALAAARAGRFPASIEADVSVERLGAFFDRVNAHYQVKPALRERIVFAPQSVTDDPPYSKLDLISCRNLLIYLNAKAQRRLLMLFHFALKDTGFLFLGRSETAGKQSDLFEPLSKTYRLYRRLATGRQYRMAFPTAYGLRETPTEHGGAERAPQSFRHADQIARDILLSEHVPASVLVNRTLEILSSYGPTQDYLALPLGEVSHALLDMVHEPYRNPVRTATHRAFRDDEANAITSRLDDSDDHSVRITARPLKQPKNAGLMLITFERVPGAARAADTADRTIESQLAEELDATREELHGTIAALEEANEDLKGSNEEVMSMNEELQSTNEELETSKEELQSVNEELTTVNSELETKVSELETAHNDLNNLFSGTQMATLFLDRSLRIKRFTPAIDDVLNLLSSDIGRPLRDMTLKIDDPNLLTDANQVLEQLTPHETDVQADDDRWFQRRIMPYRTRNDVIDGVVITFVDVTALKEAMLLAREHEARLDLATGALTGGMWEIPIDPDNPDELPDEMYLSPRLKHLIGFADEQLPNSVQAWTERIVGADRTSYSDMARRRQADAGRPVHYRIRHRDGSLRWLASYGTLVANGRGHSTRWVGIDCDITAYKAADRRVRDTQAQLQRLVDALPQLIAFVDSDNTIRSTNAAFNECFDTKGVDLSGRRVASLMDEAASATLAPCAEAALEGKAIDCEVALAGHGDRHFNAHHVPHVIDGDVVGYYLIMTDTAARGAVVADDERERLVYIQRIALVGEMASTLAHDLKQPLSAINTYASGLTHMLHAGKPADETAPIVRKMTDQVERTRAIIDGVRGLVGRPGDGHDPLDVNELLDDATHLSAGRADKANVDMRVSQHSRLPEITGEAAQLKQVLINLINNAIEAMADTDRNQRTLWLATTSPDRAHVQVVITDAGPGIPPHKLDAVFDAFQSTKLDGMGMGLAISRAIARWHGGDLWVESQPDHGATFYLRLPIATTESGAPEPSD